MKYSSKLLLICDYLDDRELSDQLWLWKITTKEKCFDNEQDKTIGPPNWSNECKI